MSAPRSLRDEYPILAEQLQGVSIPYTPPECVSPVQREIHKALTEIDQLRRWKREATTVLDYWDAAFERSGITGPLGGSKPDLMADEIVRLRAQVVELLNPMPIAELRRIVRGMNPEWTVKVNCHPLPTRNNPIPQDHQPKENP